MTVFPREILKQLEGVFDEGVLQTLVFRRADSSSDSTDSAVKVIHIPSGIEVECNQFESQIQNKAMAIEKLIGQLPNAGH